MKIWSQRRPGVYWVEPGVYGPADVAGRRSLDPGLKLEFATLGGPGAGSLLDTDDEQRSRGWDDAKREAVEAWLMASNEWGFSLFLADESLAAGRFSGKACQVVTAASGGVRVCGRPVAEDAELCDLHEVQIGTLTERESPDELDVVLPAPPEKAAV